MRGLSDAERDLLGRVSRWGSGAYPIRKLGRGWTWGSERIAGPPKVFKTKREAVASFEVYHDVLLDALAGRV